jgi:hypothetical protein
MGQAWERKGEKCDVSILEWEDREIVPQGKKKHF